MKLLCPRCKHENHGEVACLVSESFTDHPCLCGVYCQMTIRGSNQ
jgi:hypothetical protein